MHSPNQLYAAIPLLKIITAISAYSGHQKKTFLLPLYHISLTKVDKNCDHLGCERWDAQTRLQASQINICNSNPNAIYLV